MGIKYHDTNLSYHTSWWVGRYGVAIDWWYDMGMRWRWWMPVQIRFYKQEEHPRELAKRGICPVCRCKDCMADGAGMLWCPNCDT